MGIEINHTVVPARDKVASAKFFARLFGLPFEEHAVGAVNRSSDWLVGIPIDASDAIVQCILD